MLLKGCSMYYSLFPHACSRLHLPISHESLASIQSESNWFKKEFRKKKENCRASLFKKVFWPLYLNQFFLNLQISSGLIFFCLKAPRWSGWPLAVVLVSSSSAWIVSWRPGQFYREIAGRRGRNGRIHLALTRGHRWYGSRVEVKYPSKIVAPTW